MPAKMASHSHSSTPTFYIPVVSPPTPAPSPRLSAFNPLSPSISAHLASSSHPSPSDKFPSTQPFSASAFAALTPALRFQHLAALLAECTPEELLFISTTITPLLRRDFLRDLPAELAFHVLSFVDDPRTLARASRVSRTWSHLLEDQWLWKRMCDVHGYRAPEEDSNRDWREDECGVEDDLDAISNISGECPHHCSLHYCIGCFTSNSCVVVCVRAEMGLPVRSRTDLLVVRSYAAKPPPCCARSGQVARARITLEAPQRAQSI